jgi:glycosyltransferase involved in cell wall biosynthesis
MRNGVERPLRILHVIWSLSPETGGPPHAVRGLSAELARLGCRVEIWTTDPDVTEETVRTDRGIEEHRFPAERPRRWRYSPRLGISLMERVGDFDLVHVHGVWLYPTTAASRACMKRDIPYIIRPCGMLDRHSLRQRWFKKFVYAVARERWNLRGAAGIHFTTVREMQGANTFGSPARGIVVPNGIVPEAFGRFNGTAGIIERCGLGGKRYILYLGRVNRKKGLESLCEGYKAIESDYPDTRLVIAGPDIEPYAYRFKDWLVHLWGERHGVIFTGHVSGEDKVQLLAGAYAFALPSHRENFGISIVEAMASGRPVIVSDQVDICEEIAEAGAGTVVPVDAGATAEAMKALLDSPEKAAKMGKNGMALTRARYDQKGVALRMAEEYAKILAGRTVVEKADGQSPFRSGGA